MQEFVLNTNKLYGMLHNNVLTGYPLIELHPSSSFDASKFPPKAIFEADN